MQRKHNKKSKKLVAVVLVMMFCLIGCSKEAVSSEITSSVQTEAVSLSPKDMTVEEMLKHIKLYGEEVSLPCKVSELPKTVTLGNGYTYSDGGAVCDVVHDGKVIGVAHFYKMKSNEFKEINMSTGYENEVIYAFTLDAITKGVDCFDIVGITAQDTKDSAISKLGTPLYGEGQCITYESERAGKKCSLGLFFDDNGNMSLLDIYVVEEEKN